MHGPNSRNWPFSIVCFAVCPKLCRIYLNCKRRWRRRRTFERLDKAFDNQLSITNEDFEQHVCVDSVATCGGPSNENSLQNFVGQLTVVKIAMVLMTNRKRLIRLSVCLKLWGLRTFNVFLQIQFDVDVMKTMMSRIRNAVWKEIANNKLILHIDLSNKQLCA